MVQFCTGIDAQTADLGSSIRKIEILIHGVSFESLIELERSRLDTTHPEVGSLLAASWGLPERLASNIGDHHTDGASLLPAVRLVAGLRETVSEGGEMQPEDEAMLELAREEFGLAPDWTVAAIGSSVQEAADLQRRLI